MIRSRKSGGGFTLIELLVTVSIFVIMTVLLVIKYGNFNQSVLLTNLAYDSALAIRTAQNYGLSVKGVRDADGNLVDCGSGENFQCAYGVYFTIDPSGGNNKQFILFADIDGDNKYETTDAILSTYTLKSGATISNLCAGADIDACDSSLHGLNDTSTLNITFRRPDPSAIICNDVSICTSATLQYAKITIQTSDGNSRSISVRGNGQISVDN